ncbi:butyryl-CoA dehydrogenase [Klebsiella michiganensis]|uniref:Butyryl-CoA dehydrogenase n=1 Tax=Klebsiella michiganensis TaxID=1134687 RepID=A0A7H4PL99_9ENTR|nr:butyryl-CoA dehydrogenase [Klebsiella michiganensis]
MRGNRQPRSGAEQRPGGRRARGGRVACRCASRAGCGTVSSVCQPPYGAAGGDLRQHRAAARDWLVTWLGTRIPGSLGNPFPACRGCRKKSARLTAGYWSIAVCWKRPRSWAFPPLRRISRKFTITDNAIQAVNLALELTGNHGLSRQNPLERHYRNVLCGRVHTPQSDSAWLAAGKHAFQKKG